MATFDSAQKAMRAMAEEIQRIGLSITEGLKVFGKFKKTYRRGKWKMTAKTGRNKKERLRDQIRLKGRGCRIHRGRYPTRGKGTTSRSR